MIIALGMQEPNRVQFNVETDERGLGVVQIRHVRDPLKAQDVIEIAVELSAAGDDVRVETIVRPL